MVTLLLHSRAFRPISTSDLLLHFCYRHVLCVTLFVSALLLLGASHFVGVNTSASAAPVGFYLRTAPRLGRGKLVEVCLPPAVAEFGISRGYIGRSWRCPDGSETVGKIVLAMPGDVIDVEPATVLKADTSGRPLRHFPFGEYRVRPGEVWLYGAAFNSYDSRYYGPVPTRNVRASLRPLWTW